MTTSRCGSCRAEVIWAHTTTGRRMPVDAQPVEGGNVVLLPAVSPGDAPTAVVAPIGALLMEDDGTRYTSHFATCPNADSHRRSR